MNTLDTCSGGPSSILLPRQAAMPVPRSDIQETIKGESSCRKDTEFRSDRLHLSNRSFARLAFSNDKNSRDPNCRTMSKSAYPKFRTTGNRMCPTLQKERLGKHAVQIRRYSMSISDSVAFTLRIVGPAIVPSFFTNLRLSTVRS